jgi:adenosylmethionine-8-amino-7-oxononanoate aminotransferase
LASFLTLACLNTTMNDLVILGTDTDAGKTTFALLWLSRYAGQYDYWKPVQTGPSDSDKLLSLVPGVRVHPAVLTLDEPVAPPLAARRVGMTIPLAGELAAAKPTATRALLIETFGSPFSPLNETELQIAFVQELRAPTILVASSALGAIGRTLQGLESLARHAVHPLAVVLMGPHDEYAKEQIAKHGHVEVFCVQPPQRWDVAGVRDAAESQRDELERLRQHVQAVPTSGVDVDVLFAKDAAMVWHPYTALRGADEPLLCVGAEREFLHLADGRRVIDGISSWWTIQHGHRHPPLVQALHEASAEIDHVMFAGITHRWGVELAELLLKSTAWDGGRVFYSDNGSTAVEVALKMAYQFWCHRGESQRTRFVGFENGYHGDTFGAMAVSRDPVFFGRFEPLLFQADILPLDPNRLDEHLRQHRSQTSAIIVEPLVQGAGGMVMHRPATLRELHEVAQRHDVLFIADEVMTGGWRTGTCWAHEQANIKPDLIAAAKTLTGGLLPLAATLASPRVVAAFESDDRRQTFFHGHSFTGHPLACAVALRNQQLLEVAPPAAPRRFAEFWHAELAPLREVAKDVRIRGSIAAVQLDVPGGYLAETGRRLRQTCLAHGVLLRPLGNVLYALPPFCTSDDSLARIAAAMKAAVTAG